MKRKTVCLLATALACPFGFSGAANAQDASRSHTPLV